MKKKNNKIQYITTNEVHSGGEFEYKMPRDLYESLSKECRKNKAGDIHQYLCDYVNEQLGLLGFCVRVICG